MKSRATPAKREVLAVNIDAGLKRALKVEAVKAGETMAALVERAITLLLKTPKP